MSIYTKLTPAQKKEIARAANIKVSRLNTFLRGASFPWHDKGHEIIKLIKQYANV